MTLSPSRFIESRGTLGRARTWVFNFGEFDIIASIVRPDEQVIHVGGTHTDSPLPQQKWPSLDAAIDKVTAKAQDMEAKCRIHELPYAGCKFGIFVSNTALLRGLKRKDLFGRLAEVLNNFDGLVYTGADVNTSLFDIRGVFQVSPWVLGKPKDDGGSGDPSDYTADAIVRLHTDLMQFIHPESPELSGKRIAIKGAAGKVGSAIVARHYGNVNLRVADINDGVDGLPRILRLYPSVETRPPEFIHRTHADIFCPADSTITLPDRTTVDELRCLAIIGPANDQNRTPEFENVLFQRGILHPSMNGALENGAGLLAVLDELEEGGFSRDRLTGKINALVAKTVEICQESRARQVPPHFIIEDRYLRR